MTTAPTAASVRHAVTTALHHTGLRITEDTTSRDLVITNPAKPARGRVTVNLRDPGITCWKAPHHRNGHEDYFGYLEHTTPGPPHRPWPVPLLLIIHLLTADTG